MKELRAYMKGCYVKEIYWGLTTKRSRGVIWKNFLIYYALKASPKKMVKPPF